MSSFNIERKLWHMVNDRHVELSQWDLLEKTESLVILGEAGMGKSHLLAWLSKFQGYKFCTARQLINRHDPKTLLNDGKVLLIDALDEVSAHKDGDAVDLVLRQLGKLGYPNFVLSCRVADWRDATGRDAIHEQYSDKPIVLHLESFTDVDALLFLTETHGSAIADRVINHFKDRGLNGLLGNPQTLELIARIAKSESLPETRSELFERAIEVLRIEHRESKVVDHPVREIGLSAAGAGFAALILTGNEAIIRATVANAAEGELQLAEIASLPGANAIESMIGTRLFKAYGSAGRFSYLHRRVGEYLGAQWLAKQADTPRKRKRLLALFHGYGLVPASLRGIHAWLARDPFLAQAVIAADPMGVIEYGDADDLTIEQARSLIGALELLAEDNPHFRERGSYSIRGLLKPALIDDMRRIIIAKKKSPGLRMLLLQAINGSAVACNLKNDLIEIILDVNEFFALRSDAIEAMVNLDRDYDWLAIVRALYAFCDEDSLRLAIELIDNVGYELFDDELIVNLAVAYAKLSSHTIGALMSIERGLPGSRIKGVLDCLAVQAKMLGEPHERSGDEILTDFAYYLIVRVLVNDEANAEQLWSWLEPFDSSVGYDRESRSRFSEQIKQHDALRQAVQRLVLLDIPNEDDIWKRQFDLSDKSHSLTPNNDDVISLLVALDADNRNDERWRDVVSLARHDGEIGSEVRAVARPFALHSPELMEWIDALSNPPAVPDWKIKQDDRAHKRRAEQEAKHAEHKSYYTTRITQMFNGDYSVIIDPAKAYLKFFNDVGQDVLAHERVAQWLGDDIADAAHAGFDAFISLNPPLPSAQQIATSLAEGRGWDAGYIIVAAFAERHRKAIGFDDLSDERLMACLFELHRTGIEHHAGIVGLREVIEFDLKIRGAWEKTMRLLHECQLEARREHVEGLYQLMRDESNVALGNQLAAEWLARFSDLPAKPEAELIERLMRSGWFDQLRIIAASRDNFTDKERRRTWCAVKLLVDFEQFIKDIDAGYIVEPELLWHIRNMTGGRSGNNLSVVSAVQLEWIINSFRALWPMVERPDGATWGDAHPWDASNLISGLIRRLGNDPSENALIALMSLQNAPVDGYSELIKVVLAEQKRVRVETAYFPPALDAINVILRDHPPVYSVDLQELVVELLAVVQLKVKSDDVDSWRGFYDENSVPFEEERCRDHLIGLLRQEPEGIAFEPEVHVANDKRVDIACSVGKLRMPIEVKGQWHKDLWQGADIQLDARYANDWRAEGRGIYLVLWFGEQVSQNKRLKSQGQEQVCPGSPDELQGLLTASSQSAREGRVSIFVLDLARP